MPIAGLTIFWRDDIRSYAVALLVAAAVSIPAAAWARKLALDRGLVDPTGGRKQHKLPTPRVGGFGIFAGFLLGSVTGLLMLGRHLGDGRVLATVLPMLCGATLMFFTGLADDLSHRQGREGLPAGVKLVAQLAAACVVASVARVQYLQVPGGGYISFPEWLQWASTVFWIVVVMNSINFIDGMDGLAGGVSLIFALSLALVGISRAPGVKCYGEAVLAIALVGGLVGFLRLNFPPAKVFMGDGGALLLGYVLAAISVSGLMKSAALIGVLAPLMVLALPMVDLVKVVAGRVMRGENPMKADRTHLHHRLADAGWSVYSALLFAYALAGLCGCAAMSLLRLRGAGVVLALTVALMLIGVATRRPRGGELDGVESGGDDPA
ncbi:MAG: undecaprenyl/decaprenyl-phosphate alpha-N-acetylglucosaminyl 1-phosphate transferase [Armatimonadetes bacterium]|nr:undecaprenyl/decaprenyl-phosphate alpha-N-acetylglucosaminyl 1-phosphate transferase [Armatimonadota bacterium]